MSVKFSDNLTINAGKPTRDIDLVGVGQIYTDKDDIPMGYRYEFLPVYETATKKTYQLQGGTDNADWIDITPLLASAGIQVSTKVGNAIKVITTPGEEGIWVKTCFTQEQCDRLAALVYINAVSLFTIAPTVIQKGVSIDIVCSYNVTLGDDTYVGYIIEGTSIPVGDCDGATHTIDVNNIGETDSILSRLEVTRLGAQEFIEVTRVVTAVEPTYIGDNVTGNIPTDVEVLAGVPKIVKTNVSVASLFTFVTDKFGWFAVPTAQTGSAYGRWSSTASVSDNGPIDGASFIRNRGEIDVGGVEYTIYMFDQAKTYGDTITLTK